jgi:hypothetical protein
MAALTHCVRARRGGQASGCSIPAGVWIPLSDFLELVEPYAASDEKHQAACNAGQT